MMCERPDSGKHLIVRGSGYLDGNLSSGKNFILLSPQSRLLNKRLMAHSGKNLIVCEQQSALTSGAYRRTMMRRLETAAASRGFPRQPGFVNLAKQP
jgi:hypothetical protein